MNIKSAFIRKRNSRYNVYIEYFDEISGKDKQRSQASYTNKKDADKHLIDIKSSINNNKFIISKDITFVDRYKKYIYDESKNFSPLTVSKMENMLNVNVEPFFKDMLLKDITPYALQTFINNVYSKYAKSTSKNKVAVVKSIINEAYRLREMQENPCDFVKAPAIKNDDFTAVKEPFSREEAKIVIEKYIYSYSLLPQQVSFNKLYESMYNKCSTFYRKVKK